MKRGVIRRQRPIPGGRERLGAGVLRSIEAAVQRDADRHRVSKSFVISVVLAHHYGIKEQEKL